MAFAHGASHRLGRAVALFLGLATDKGRRSDVECRFRENFCFRYGWRRFSTLAFVIVGLLFDNMV